VNVDIRPLMKARDVDGLARIVADETNYDRSARLMALESLRYMGKAGNERAREVLRDMELPKESS
jgi:hypothetical protein